MNSGVQPHHRLLAWAAAVCLVFGSLTLVGASPAAASSAGTLSGTVLGPVTCASAGAPYPDVATSNPHCDNIWWLRGTSITKPADGRYHPGDAVTRGSMTAFLFRLTHPGTPSPTCTAKPFPDVATDSVFCGYIQWARRNKIAFGYDDGTFKPSRGVTRGAMAAFLQRLVVGRPAPKCTIKPFADVSVGSMFCKPIAWMRTHHLTYGVGDGTYYGTTDLVTRQSMASFLRRIASNTDAAPKVSTTEVGPLAGASVLVVDESGDRIYHETSRSDGTFSVNAAPGGYRVCVDGGTVTTPSATGYRDSCYGGVSWPWDDPMVPSAAPEVSVESGKSLTGMTIILPTLARSADHRRGRVITPSTMNSHYEFLFTATGTGQKFAYYNPCEAVHYVIQNSALTPSFGIAMTTKAIETVSRATGLRFIFDGFTNETPQYPRDPYQSSRYGDRPAPLLVSWTEEGRVFDDNGKDLLGGDVVGIGGGSGYTGASGLSLLQGGFLYLDTPQITRILQGTYYPHPRAHVEAILLHELGHAVGLAHVDDPAQLMYPTLTPGVTDYGAGDLTGLSILGRAACPSRPTGDSHSIRAPRLDNPVHVATP